MGKGRPKERLVPPGGSVVLTITHQERLGAHTLRVGRLLPHSWRKVMVRVLTRNADKVVLEFKPIFSPLPTKARTGRRGGGEVK